MSKGIYNLNFKNFNFKVVDVVSSTALQSIFYELKSDDYSLNNINFKDEDIVIDVGAHVGTISFYISKLNPNIKIYAYEPILFNYESAKKGIELNKFKNIELNNLAVTGDGRDLQMIVNYSDNSGGGTSNLKVMQKDNHYNFCVKSTTLNRIFEENNIDKCKLLKIDCEGSEYEILYNCKYLDRIEYLSMELHTNTLLREKGYSGTHLLNYISKYIDKNKIKLTKIRMAE